MGALYSFFYPEVSLEDALTEKPLTNGPAPTQPVALNGSDITGVCLTVVPTNNPYPGSSPEVDEVDKRNIIVKNLGKSVEVEVFPDEMVKLLLQEACQHFQKKDRFMKMVYKGEELDVNKTIRESHLRAGCAVNLIRAS